MTAEIGHFALYLALMLALAQSFFPLVGAARRNTLWMSVAEPAAVGQLAFVAIAFGALVRLYVTSDFSVATVAAYSHSMLPLPHTVT